MEHHILYRRARLALLARRRRARRRHERARGAADARVLCLVERDAVRELLRLRAREVGDVVAARDVVRLERAERERAAHRAARESGAREESESESESET